MPRRYGAREKVNQKSIDCQLLTLIMVVYHTESFRTGYASMIKKSLNIVAQKILSNPDIAGELLCTVGIVQNFLEAKQLENTLLVAINADVSNPQSAGWKLYRLLTGVEVDRQNPAIVENMARETAGMI